VGGHATHRQFPRVRRSCRSLLVQFTYAWYNNQYFITALRSPLTSTVRYIPKGTSPASEISAHKPPFVIQAAPNVFLETIKRGDDDHIPSSPSVLGKGQTTMVLRFFEAYGGHARAQLRIPSRLIVKKAALTNLLEEEEEELRLVEGGRDGDDEGETHIHLNFHGFEVKTLKLVIGGNGSEAADALRYAHCAIKMKRV
jgi:alpha-mannosidase